MNFKLKKQVTNTSGFVEFPAKHIYTANHKTFELRRSMLDTYINVLFVITQGCSTGY